MGDSQGTGQSTRTRRSAELSAEEIAFFKHNGYLIVQGGFDAQLCAEAVDRMWQELPADSDLRRDDPATHTGRFLSAINSSILCICATVFAGNNGNLAASSC